MRQILEQVLSGNSLTLTDAAETFAALTEETSSPAMAAALLAALRTKGETPDEIRGFAIAMRGMSRRPAISRGIDAVDIVGTGGDGSGSLNLSTGAALLTAACGLPVVKHGNRSISSKSGSADVLEALGMEMPLNEQAAARHLERTGFTFLYAPYYHPAMKALASVRKCLGVRTALNVLGPLTNPAQPKFYVIGAFSVDVARLLADTLAGLEAQRAFVIHGAAGWDEATPIGPFTLFDVQHGTVRCELRDPADYGLRPCSPDDLAGGNAALNAARLRSALDGEPGAHRDALALGTALALEVANRVAQPTEGVQHAYEAIDSGRAAEALRRITEPASLFDTAAVGAGV